MEERTEGKVEDQAKEEEEEAEAEEVQEEEAAAALGGSGCSDGGCGAYLAVLPATPAVTPDDLWEACRTVAASPQVEVKWRFRRTCSLVHPQLDRPLQYLEVSGIVADEASCDAVVTALLKLDKVVGNAELVLCLEGTEIPLLPVELPMDGTSESLEKFGVVGIPNAISSRHGGDDNENDEADDDEADEDLLKEVLEYAVQQFEVLYERLAAKSHPRRYREIMQRDSNRFDFRLDLPPPSHVQDADDESPAPCWKRLEERGTWMPLVKGALGEDVVRVKCGCVLSLPGAQEQYWHSDGIHVGPALSLPISGQEANPPHALCVFVPLVSLTLETGGTEFWAGSHRYERLLSKKGEQALPGGTLGIVPRGGAVAYDYRVVHRGMANRSDAARPIAYYLYAKMGHESVEDQNFVHRSIWD